ncbi:hypothetical protein FWF74_02165 [Candidatus Saccharibacteria bacterium]|nr:hypothetical protein [Candidatus Saccharibacteria bacterium]MCL1963368.1 hypothetical protein [Candidatus Saccharibacteria bacterium]
MRLIMIYREKSEQRAAAEVFLHDFKYQTGHDIETLDPDTPAGQTFIVAHDIVEYPTLIALGPDGTELTKWRGTLPTISEASAYN